MIEEIGMSEIDRRTKLANMQLLELKVDATRMSNEKLQLDLDERIGALCYFNTALKEFSRVLNSFVGEVRGLPDELQSICNFTPEQYNGASGVVNDILQRLSKVTVNLESSAELKARASQLAAKNSAQAERRGRPRKGTENGV